MEIFTLLLSNNIKCCKCDLLSTHILLGKENEFLGFYCIEHGFIQRDRLENKYQFEKEMKRGKEMPKLRKQIRRKKTR